jgi:peptide/nickel transport system permease protein
MSFWPRFLARWQNWMGLSMAMLFVAVAITAPVISPEDPKNPGAFKVVGRFTDLIPHPPGENPKAILGTLPGQFDVFHTLIWGCRDAMRFGLFMALGSFIFGVMYGAISGYAGGGTNNLMMRVADAFLTFPPLAGAVLLQQLAGTAIVALGGQYYFNAALNKTVLYFDGPLPALAVLLQTVDPLLISLILFSWMPYARLVNTIVIPLKQSGFTLAARALGAGPLWVIRKHLLPNSVSPAIVLAARDVGSAVILQATVVVIGLGGSSPWGKLLAIGRDWITGGVLRFWWVYIPVTLAMVLFGITWNLLGDGLSDTLLPAPGIHRARRRSGENTSILSSPALAQTSAGASRQAQRMKLFGMTSTQIALLTSFLVIECLLAIGFVLVTGLNP